jgi:hypothetical protein
MTNRCSHNKLEVDQFGASRRCREVPAGSYPLSGATRTPDGCVIGTFPQPCERRLCTIFLPLGVRAISATAHSRRDGRLCDLWHVLCSSASWDA